MFTSWTLRRPAAAPSTANASLPDSTAGAPSAMKSEPQQMGAGSFASPSTAAPSPPSDSPSTPFPQLPGRSASAPAPAPMNRNNRPQLDAPRRRWTFAAIITGLDLLRDGTIRGLRSPRARKPLFRALAVVVGFVAVLYFLNSRVTWPLRILRWFLNALQFSQDSMIMKAIQSIISTVDGLFMWLLVNMPDAGLYFLRYVYPEPLDVLFFEAMKTMTYEISLPGPSARFSLRFARSLESNPSTRLSYFKRLGAYMKRSTKRLGILFVVWIASCVPIVGRLAWPAATFFFLQQQLGLNFAIWCCGIGLVSPPWWKFLKGPLLRKIFQFRSVCRELVDPYLSRSKMNSTQRRAWFHKHEPVISAFSFPFFVLLQVPVAGPILYIELGCAAAARLCLACFDDIDFGPRDQSSVGGTGSTGENDEDVEEWVLRRVAARADAWVDWAWGMWHFAKNTFIPRARGSVVSDGPNRGEKVD
ncbi:hypothetical protein DFJ73DRAFT_856663 [Zopfochytrium polystomum]|nr:hypothetical protein DFJ73DRAFT_856663 [Zopfochytrium polystomum]